MLKRVAFYCFVFAVLEGFFAMPALGGWLESAKPCEQSVPELIKNGYKYRHLLTLVSDDEASLVVFVRFYQTRKLRGRVYEAINITTKLLRYRMAGQGDYALTSELGTCDDIIDIEHHRGLMDASGNVYLFTQSRGRNAFSVWPADNKRPVAMQAVSGANLGSSRMSLNRSSGLIYAIEGKHIVRSENPGSFSFSHWLQFDGAMEKGKIWNPLFIHAAQDRVSIGLIIWDPGASFAGDRFEYWEFDLDGNLKSKRKVEDKNLRELHPGPPLFGIYVTDERMKSQHAADFLHFTTWHYTLLETGESKTIIHLDTNQTSPAISAQGSLFIVYDNEPKNLRPAFSLVRYHPATGLSKSTLALLK